MKLKIAAAILATHLSVSPGNTKQHSESLCLAKNIYWEARGEPLQGQLAVAWTTINRANHPSFPQTICEVVYQNKQFSWTINKKPNREIPQPYIDLAEKAINEQFNFKALYFHNTKVNPSWAKYKVKVANIGNHRFYK